MPYTVRHMPVKSGKDWAIIRLRDNHIVGRSFTKPMAESGVRARLAGEHGAFKR